MGFENVAVDHVNRVAALRFSHCAVPENTYTHFKEGQQKFKGGGGFKGKYDTKLTFPEWSGGFKLRNLLWGGGGMDIF